MMNTEGKDQDFFKKGIEYHDKGNFKKAFEMYKMAIETYGLDKKILVLMGNVYYQSKEFEKAEDLYKNALSLDPNYSKAYFNLGVIYEGTERYNEAINAYKKSIEFGKDFGEAYANLGDVYKTLGDLDNAILNYKNALEIGGEIENAKKGLKDIPDDLIEKITNHELISKSDELIRKGIILEKEGNISDAAKKYKESLEVFPKSAAGLFLLNLLATPSETQVLSKEEIGFIKLNTPLICDSISLEVMEFLGKKLGNVEFRPTNLEYFFDRFKEIVIKQNGTEIDLFKISRLILFEEPEKVLSQALDLELEGDIENTKNRYKEVLEKAPYLVHAYHLYGIFLELNDDESEALQKYKQAAQYNFDYLDKKIKADIIRLFSQRPSFEYLTEMDIISILKEFLDNTLHEESISLLRFIKYKLSLEAEAKIKYGYEKEVSGDSLEAINAYKDAIDIDPNNIQTHYVLGLAYETRGLEKEAMAEYGKTENVDFEMIGNESSEEISEIIGEYLTKTTKDGHPVGTILNRYIEIISDDPERMLELLGYIEDLNLESISRIIKAHISTDMILDRGGKVVRDELDFGEDLDEEKDKIERSKEMSKSSFELPWKYKTQRSIRCEACTSDGKKTLAGSENGVIYFIDQNANAVWRYESRVNVSDIDISPEGKYGVFCNSNNIVELLDCNLKGRSLWKKDMRESGINSVAISSNANTIAVATNNFEIIFFDREGNQKKSYAMDQMIKSVDITDEGGITLASSPNNLFLISGKAGLQMLNAFNPSGNIQSISISKAGNLISVGTKKGFVYLLDNTGRVLWKDNTLNPVYGVSVSSDGKVVSGTMNGTLLLYSNKGEQLWKYQTGENIWGVDISEDGGRIISGCGLVFGNVYLFKIK